MPRDSARNRRNGFETVNGGQDFQKAAQSGGKVLGIIALVLAVLILIFNSAYQIKEQEQAVLITWGKASPVTTPGLHFKIPFVQKVKKVNTTIQGFTIGYNVNSNVSNESESLMITFFQ